MAEDLGRGAMAEDPGRADLSGREVRALLAVSMVLAPVAYLASAFVVASWTREQRRWSAPSQIVLCATICTLMSNSVLTIAAVTNFVQGSNERDSLSCQTQAYMSQFADLATTLFSAAAAVYVCLEKVTSVSWIRQHETTVIGATHAICWLVPLALTVVPPFVGVQYGPLEAWCWIEEPAEARIYVGYLIGLVALGVMCAALFATLWFWYRSGRFRHQVNPFQTMYDLFTELSSPSVLPPDATAPPSPAPGLTAASPISIGEHAPLLASTDHIEIDSLLLSLYALVYFVLWLPNFCLRILDTTDSLVVPVELLFLQVISFPIQGCMQLVVYARCRRVRAMWSRDTAAGAVLDLVLFLSFITVFPLLFLFTLFDYVIVALLELLVKACAALYFVAHHGMSGWELQWTSKPVMRSLSGISWKVLLLAYEANSTVAVLLAFEGVIRDPDDFALREAFQPLIICVLFAIALLLFQIRFRTWAEGHNRKQLAADLRIVLSQAAPSDGAAESYYTSKLEASKREMRLAQLAGPHAALVADHFVVAELPEIVYAPHTTPAGPVMVASSPGGASLTSNSPGSSLSLPASSRLRNPVGSPLQISPSAGMDSASREQARPPIPGQSLTAPEGAALRERTIPLSEYCIGIHRHRMLTLQLDQWALLLVVEKILVWSSFGDDVIHANAEDLAVPIASSQTDRAGVSAAASLVLRLFVCSLHLLLPTVIWQYHEGTFSADFITVLGMVSSFFSAYLILTLLDLGWAYLRIKRAQVLRATGLAIWDDRVVGLGAIVDGTLPRVSMTLHVNNIKAYMWLRRVFHPARPAAHEVSLYLFAEAAECLLFVVTPAVMVGIVVSPAYLGLHVLMWLNTAVCMGFLYAFLSAKLDMVRIARKSAARMAALRDNLGSDPIDEQTRRVLAPVYDALSDEQQATILLGRVALTRQRFAAIMGLGGTGLVVVILALVVTM